MARARGQDITVGRPHVVNKDDVAKKWLKVRQLLYSTHEAHLSPRRGLFSVIV
jgi:hypothetical protein